MAASAVQLGGGLRSQVEQRDGRTWIGLSGHLNEAADLTPLTQLPGPLVIDLSGLDRINSLGVRDWMRFIRTCETAGVDLTFERCSPTIVGQISMITNFMGTRSQISSVEVPYLCTSCASERIQLLELVPGAELQLTITCPKCGAPMELDDLVETYAEIMRRARR